MLIYQGGTQLSTIESWRAQKQALAGAGERGCEGSLCSAGQHRWGREQRRAILVVFVIGVELTVWTKGNGGNYRGCKMRRLGLCKIRNDMEGLNN